MSLFVDRSTKPVWAAKYWAQPSRLFLFLSIYLSCAARLLELFAVLVSRCLLMFLLRLADGVFHQATELSVEVLPAKRMACSQLLFCEMAVCSMKRRK